tara:strand:+ start:13019 stop:13876 length:858 start_codon:yes stop_codon:yes gene_type:complete
MMTLNYEKTVSYGVPIWKTILNMTPQERCSVDHIYGVIAASPRFHFLCEVLQLDQNILESPENKTIFISSFIHNSFVNETDQSNLQSYERAEFLGDSILQFILSSHLMKAYPELNEGQLSKLRSSLVNEDSLAEIASSVGLVELLISGKGNQTHKLDQSDAIKADLFESLLGALYQIYGLEFTKDAFMRMIHFYEDKTEQKFFDLSRLQLFDPKSTLQEFVLKETKELPKYEVEEKLIDGETHFYCKVFEKDILLGSGSGLSKKLAQKKAAKNAITNKESKYYIK